MSLIENFSHTQQFQSVIIILKVMFYERDATRSWWHSHSKSRQEQVDRNSSLQSWATRWQIEKDFASTSNATITSKERNMHLHVNCVCTIGMYEPRPFVAQNGIVIEVCRTAASQNCHGLKGATMMKEGRSITALVGKSFVWERSRRRWTLLEIFLDSHAF